MARSVRGLGGMEYEHLLERVRQHTGLSERPVVETALRAVTEALGAVIDHTHREEFAAHLPPELAPMLRRREPDGDASGATFLRLVSGIEHLPPRFAVEHATAVLEAIGSELHPNVRRRIASRLPPEMRDWMEPRVMRMPRAEPAKPSDGREAQGTHLSDAQPGSRRPISDVAPRGAHTHSVAASEDPHADTRLSSAHGTTQQREHEDLAEARPGPERSLGDPR